MATSISSCFSFCIVLFLQSSLCMADDTCTSASSSFKGDTNHGSSLLQNAFEHGKQVIVDAEDVESTPVPVPEIDDNEQPEGSIDEDVEDTHDKCQELRDKINVSFEKCVDCAESCLEATEGDDGDGEADKAFVKCHEDCLGTHDANTDALEKKWLDEEAGGSGASFLLEEDSIDNAETEDKRYCRRRRAGGGCGCWCRRRRAAPKFDVVGEGRIDYKHMNASQSSTGEGGTASRALATQHDPTWPGTCTHTMNNDQPWWKVSLGGSQKVASVVLTNRAGCCPDRLQGLDIFIGDSKCASNVNIGAGAHTKVLCSGTGSQITVKKQGSGILTICGFAAFKDLSGTQCPANYPICNANGNCVIHSCSNGDCSWNHAPSADTNPAETYNWISGYDNSNTDCSGDYLPPPAPTPPPLVLTSSDIPALGDSAKCCTSSHNACGRVDVDVSSYGRIGDGNKISFHNSWNGKFEVWCDGAREHSSTGNGNKVIDMPANCVGDSSVTLKCGGHCGGCNFHQNQLIIYGAAASPAQTPEASSQQAGGSALSQAQVDAVVSTHNTLRAAMGASDMMMLKWNPDLARRAQEHSSTCPGSKHSSRTSRGNDGENMAASAGSSFQLTSTTDLTPSVQRWYDEISDAGVYKNGGTFSGFGECTGVCGHFTQVVWAAAHEIGCGVTSCPMQGMPGYQLTCQYRSTLSGKYGGNMGGSVLFTKGTACASCPSGHTTCTTGLCN